MTDDGQEYNGAGDNWVPQDEDFDEVKSVRIHDDHASV